MAAILKEQIYEDDIYTTIALRENLATNTEVHGNEPAKIYYNLNRMRLDDVPNSTLIAYMNRVVDENNKLRDTKMFIPDFCMLHRFTEELREVYTTRPSDAEFSKLMQTLTTLQLSHDWKNDNATPIPPRLLIDMRIAFEKYDAHNEKVKRHLAKEVDAHAMLTKKVADLETELKAAKLAGPTYNREKRQSTRKFPAFDPAHPEIFSGPGHAEKGGVTRYGRRFQVQVSDSDLSLF